MSFEDDLAQPQWKRWLINRFILVPGFLVVDAAGAPVAGAEVKLWVFNFTTFNEGASTQTKADGSFEFTDNPSHNIQLSAEKAGVGRSRIPVRLYFRSEDIARTQPLRLSRVPDGN